jgi:hypothetical protein
VSAKNAKQAADEFLSRLQVPTDENKPRFQLVTFANEEHCRFFYPRRALEWQQQVNTYISRALRHRGIRVHRTVIGPTDYDAWRGNREDTTELRRQFADEHLRFISKDR